MEVVIKNLTSTVGMKTPELENYIVHHFNPRMNLIIPNVSWGLFYGFEADLIVVSQSGYATEVELKISKADIKKDLSKSHKAHKSDIVKYFYYAVPEHLKGCEYLPSDCGLLSVGEWGRVQCLRPPRLNKDARKLNDKEIYTLQRLGCMRIWSLKTQLHVVKMRLASKNDVTKKNKT